MLVATADFGLKVAFIVGFSVIFGLVVLLPWTLDLWFAHQERRPSPAGTVATPGQGSGTPGLSRASMAMSVIVVIGFALAYLLIVNPFKDAKLASDIVVALTTTLAAIVAFYFGSKTAQESAAQAAGTNDAAGSTTLVANGSPKQPVDASI